VRRQFGDEYYISPRQERPASAAHLNLNKDEDPPPSAAAVATEEMKAYSDGGEDSVDLPPPLPNLSMKGSRNSTSTSIQHNAWDRKFNELVSLAPHFTRYERLQCYIISFHHLLIFLLPFFSLSSSSNMVIVMYRRLMHQIPNLGYG